MARELLTGALGSLVATLVWVLSVAVFYKMRDQRPFSRLFSFTRRRNIVFVFPCRPDAPGAVGLIQNARVSFEDMLAASYLQRCLSLSGWPTEKVEMRENREFDDRHREEGDGNLVLLCSPRSNNVTEDFLKDISERHSLRWSFEEQNGQLSINTAGGHWPSSTYRQAAEIEAAGGRVEDGELEDFAMIVKAPNPRNPESTVLIVAGIRGIGTWGAAYYLRDHARELSAQTKGRPFALLVRVRYKKWKIEHVAPAQPLTVLGAAAPRRTSEKFVTPHA